jgi:hypothetical protein
MDKSPRSWTMADETRTRFRPYGSEGWGFESLRARQPARYMEVGKPALCSLLVGQPGENLLSRAGVKAARHRRRYVPLWIGVTRWVVTRSVNCA